MIPAVEIHKTRGAVHKASILQPRSQHTLYPWRGVLAKFALLFFGMAMWYKGPAYIGYSFLILTWVLDGGLNRFKQMLREPLVLAILIFCGVLAAGILWGESNEFRYFRWHKYLVLLIFIPFLALLNKERLPWAISGLLIGYISIVLLGAYRRIVLGEHGGIFIPDLIRMNYLHLSPTLGIGVLVSIYLASISSNIKIRSALCCGVFLLLLFQFDLSGRSPLLATILISLLVIFLTYMKEPKKILGLFILFISVVLILAYNSDIVQKRMFEIKSDTEILQLKDTEAGINIKYGTGVGYRYALWDVGLHAISQRPLFGYGSGMSFSTFKKTIETYKDGYYKDLKFLNVFHYHNDLIEIGVYTGMVGLLAYVFFLWSWYKSLKLHRLSVLGVALPSYLLLIGLADTTLIYNAVPSLFLVITAVAISWQRDLRNR